MPTKLTDDPSQTSSHPHPKSPSVLERSRFVGLHCVHAFINNILFYFGLLQKSQEKETRGDFDSHLFYFIYLFFLNSKNEEEGNGR